MTEPSTRALETRLAEQCQVPHGVGVDWAQILEAGRRRRRQRRTAATALAATLLLIAGAGATALSRRGGREPAATLTVGVTTAPAADRQDAGYLTVRVQVSESGLTNGRTTKTAWTQTRWAGHRQPGEVLGALHSSDGTLINMGTGPFTDSGFNLVGVDPQTGQKVPTPAASPHPDWDGMWRLPRTASGLHAYYTSNTPAGRTSTVVLSAWLTALLSEPGPLQLRQAAAILLGQQPDTSTSTSTGHDNRGRAATILTTARGGVVTDLYLDPGTARPLQSDRRAVGVPGDARDVYDTFTYTDTPPPAVHLSGEAVPAPSGPSTPPDATAAGTAPTCGPVTSRRTTATGCH